MSVLPPYNPAPGERVVWILPVLAGADPAIDLLGATDGPGSAVAETEGLARVLARAGVGPAVVAADANNVVVPERGRLVAAGSPAWGEALVRRLMGIPGGGAQPVLLAGSVTRVQLLPDRAVLAHLNDGMALG